ncbi:MAG TPA: HAD family phosphatase [Gaiellaceae bacterium]|nr:HAD family phosphatase [Gaiellaceae bacterium]
MPAAVAFDFNGTLSDDEPLLARIYVELAAEHGVALTVDDYFRDYVGHTDEEIFARLLGTRDRALIEERADRYCALAADGHTISADARGAVAAVAARMPVAVVSAALRRELDVVLAGAGLTSCFTAVVSQDDVRRGKPDPECYLLAARRLGVDPADLHVFEDTDIGAAAARAAGARVTRVTRTVDRATVEQLLCS